MSTARNVAPIASRHHLILLAILFTIGASLGGVWQDASPTIARSDEARLRLRPNDGPVDSQVVARGRDFPPAANGTLVWDQGTGTQPRQLATYTTNANGEFEIAFTVPEAEPGDHILTATVSHMAASDTFTVTADNESNGDASGGTPSTEDAAGPVPAAIASTNSTYPASDDLCPAPAANGRSVTVGDGTKLTAALADARPGDVIQMKSGRYLGTFTLEASGTADAPMVLCGPREAVIDGGDIGNGYALHITGDYLTVRGLSVQRALKGIMLDGANHVTLEYLDVSLTGHEAIHLRAGSSDNLVQFNDIHDTGFKRDKFGEGVYLGSAVSNWEQYSSGQPDTSDRNRVIGNRIWNTTSESIDIKEGTTDGLIEGNVMDGSMLAGADSWVDVKGNGYTIRGNTGTSSPMDGFQTHVINDMDWGRSNTFEGNTANVEGPGYGFFIHDAETSENVVSCNNVVNGAEKGFANVDCAGP
ncbi:MAG: right-handed parallel beta-helix repeat-containing protein [Thermomicrobiales bacterium]